MPVLIVDTTDTGANLNALFFAIDDGALDTLARPVKTSAKRAPVESQGIGKPVIIELQLEYEEMTEELRQKIQEHLRELTGTALRFRFRQK